ncbi:hypothetical protein ABPG72_009048 [Tetrahymena utriculariae]
MGITGLLNLLKSIVVKRNLKEYKDKTVAIDAYTWLHPAIYTCSYELANNIETTKHIEFCTKRIDQILSCGIKKIVLVFDGRQLPCKKGTEEKREKSREDSRNEAQALFAQDKKEQAYKKFASSIDITPQMAYELIKAVESRPNVECIVAPYEADAQLAYLSQIDYVDVVFSEDSDLLAFGCKKVLFKLYKGDNKDVGDEISLDNIKNCKEINMSLWNHNMFLTACIFSGCDYLPSLKKMGINTAFKMVGEFKQYKKCLLSIQQKNYEIPVDYDERFQLAFLTFRFQYVYCPIKDEIRTLNTYNSNDLKLQFVDQDFHNQVSQTNWTYFEDSILIRPLIYKILEPNFNWSFLGDMDLNEALKVSKYMIDPETLMPYKEVKSKLFGVDNSKNNQVKLGNGGLQSLQNNQKFQKRQQSSLSDSTSSTKQTQLNTFLKVGTKNSINKPISVDQKQTSERSLFLLEDANSNSLIFNRSKMSDKNIDSQEISLSQNEIFSKNIFNKNSNLVKPFKPPSTSNSQSTQPNNIIKKKSEFKRPYNEEYCQSSDDDDDDDDDHNYLGVGKIQEQQLEDTNSNRKDNTSNDDNNRQIMNDNKQSDLDFDNNQSIYDEEQNNYESNNDLLSLNQFKSNKLIQKNIQNNIQKQNSFYGLQKQQNSLSNKFINNLCIDKTPVNEIEIPKKYISQNFEIKQVQKVVRNEIEVESEDEEKLLDQNNSQEKPILNQNNNQNQKSYQFIKKQINNKENDSQEDNKSCISTQSQKNMINQDLGGLQNNEKIQSQKLTQKTISDESNQQKNLDQQKTATSQLTSQGNKDQLEENTILSRMNNYTKDDDGQLVIDSQYLIQKHPEYNFLEKFSMFFKNEVNI